MIRVLHLKALNFYEDYLILFSESPPKANTKKRITNSIKGSKEKKFSCRRR